MIRFTEDGCEQKRQRHDRGGPAELQRRAAGGRLRGDSRRRRTDRAAARLSRGPAEGALSGPGDRQRGGRLRARRAPPRGPSDRDRHRRPGDRPQPRPGRRARPCQLGLRAGRRTHARVSRRALRRHRLALCPASLPGSGGDALAPAPGAEAWGGLGGRRRGAPRRRRAGFHQPLPGAQARRPYRDAERPGAGRPVPRCGLRGPGTIRLVDLLHPGAEPRLPRALVPDAARGAGALRPRSDRRASGADLPGAQSARGSWRGRP